MNARDAHEIYDQLAVGHALSALEPEEEQAFLAHLPGCAACERALAEHAETLAHLAYGVVADAPPPSVLEGIRAGVAASGRSGAFPAPVSLEAARSRRRDRTVRWSTAVVGAAASVVMLAALVFVNRSLQSQETTAAADAARLQSTVASLVVPGARKVDLTGTGGSGVVIVDRGNVSLVMSGLPVNDAHSVYVLWQKGRFGDVRPVGTFDIRSKDLAVVDRGLHLVDANPVRFMVTREKGRTAPALSTQPAVVAGDV